MKTKYLRMVIPVLTSAALLCSYGATDSVYTEVTAVPAQAAASAVIQGKNVTMSVEGNAGSEEGSNVSEDTLNNIFIEEEASITDDERASSDYKVEDIKEKKMYALSDCYIRKGPSVLYDTAGNLLKNDKVTVNGKVTYKDKVWYRLKTKDNTEKYVVGSLLAYVQKYKVKDIKARVMYAKSDCNIRKGPSTAYKKVGTLKKGKKVTVNGKVTYKGKTWYRLKTKNGAEKYVASSLLTSTKPSSNKNKDKDTSSGGGKKDKDKNNNSSGGGTKPSVPVQDNGDTVDYVPGDLSEGDTSGWIVE